MFTQFKQQIINPALKSNLSLVKQLIQSNIGNASGLLSPYTPYHVNDSQDGQKTYVLTYGVLQFVSISSSVPHPVCIDITDPCAEAHGSYGQIYPAVASIVLDPEGKSSFYESMDYLVKKIEVEGTEESKQLKKPHSTIRAARREHYLASQMSSLGVNYQLIEREHAFYLRMNRAPGLPLAHYVDNLNLHDFIELSCALLEELIKLNNHVIPTGKHKGKGLIHCDLHLDNVFAAFRNGAWLVTFIDWGLAKAKRERAYQTTFGRGAIGTFDLDMYESERDGKPIPYDTVSETYAVFSLIYTLAGSKNRYFTKFKTEFYRDLRTPDLNSLFNGMDMNASIKTQLNALIHEMITSVRANRLSAETALQRFRAIQAGLLPQQATPVEQPSQPAVEIYSIEDFKSLLTKKLDIPANYYEIEAIQLLATWIEKYRVHYAYLQEHSPLALVELLGGLQPLKIKNSYISTYLRYEETLKTYTVFASARLVMRHHHMIEELMVPFGEISEAWHGRFRQLLKNIPLQLTPTQGKQCTQIAGYRSNLGQLEQAILKAGSEPPFILVKLQQLVQSQLEMDLEPWIEQLPEHALWFNKRWEYCKQLVERINLAKGLPVSFLKRFDALASNLSEKLLTCDSFNSDIKTPLRLTEGLLLKLHELSKKQEILQHLGQRFPAIPLDGPQISSYEGLLDAIDLESDVAIFKFISFSERLLVVIKWFSYLYNSRSGLQKYPEVLKPYQQQFEHWADNPFASFEDKEFLQFENDLETFINFHLVIEITEKDPTFSILSGALKQILPNLEEMRKLLRMVSSGFPEKKHLPKLNKNLEYLLNLGSDGNLTKMATEIWAFYNNPSKYQLLPPLRTPTAAEQKFFKPADINSSASDIFTSMDLEIRRPS